MVSTMPGSSAAAMRKVERDHRGIGVGIDGVAELDRERRVTDRQETGVDFGLVNDTWRCSLGGFRY